MRDRLIELIQNSKCVETWDYYNDNPMKPCPIERLADYLLENGVIVLNKENNSIEDMIELLKAQIAVLQGWVKK